MVGHVTTWGVPCGIAKHLSYWVCRLTRPQVIFAEHPPQWLPLDGENWPGPEIVRCWRRGNHAGFDNVIAAAEKHEVKILHVQFDPSFWTHKDICALGDWAREKGVKIACRFHIVQTKGPFDWQNKAMLRVADQIAVGTPAMETALAEYAAKFHIALRRPIMCIPLAAPDDETPTSKTPRTEPPGPLVLTWGMLGGIKGHEQTFEAVKMLRAELYPSARYIIAGQAFTGEQRQNLDRLRELAAGHPDILEIRADFVTDEQIRKLCAEADVIVLNHQCDAYSSSGTVVVSVASGTPVVVSDSPMFSGFTERGMVIPTDGTPAGLAAGIKRALSESDALGAQVAVNRIHYLGRTIAERWEAVYQELEAA